MSLPCVLVVADPHRIAELVAAVSDPLPAGPVEVVVSAGGDDTIDLFLARRPPVVIVTATLDAGDAKSLIDALRDAVPRAEVSIVVVGDDAGPIRTALDAMELEPDRFVSRPLSGKALRYATSSALEAAQLARPSVAPAATPVVAPSTGATAPGLGGDPPRPPHTATMLGVGAPLQIEDDPTASTRAALRARWEALADSFEDAPSEERAPVSAAIADEAPPLPPPVVIAPRRGAGAAAVAPPQAWTPGTTTELDGEWPPEPAGAADPLPLREPTLIIRQDPSLRLDTGSGAVPLPVIAPGAAPVIESAPAPLPEPPVLRADLRRPTAPPLPFEDRRRVTGAPPLGAERRAPLLPRVDTEERWPVPPSASATPGGGLRPPAAPTLARANTLDGLGAERAPEPGDSVIVAERGLNEAWSEPVELPELRDRDSRRDIHPAPVDELGLDDFDDELALGGDPDDAPGLGTGPGALPRARPPEPRPAAPTPSEPPPSDDRPAGRDFARQLRAKMSQMAQRLFQGADDAPAPSAADHGPRHDHHTEFDLAAIGEEQVLADRGVTEIEVPPARPEEVRAVTSPGSWDTQVRERGVPDAGEVVRGATDAAMLLAKLFAQRSTCRLTFRRADLGVEKVVFFDQGRPVFAASNAPADRMGELLVREGKITAAQYERCQTHVAASGRRMGEILVDFGYLKRRELLPAVRRHVEDIIYSLFAWDRGTYAVALDPEPSAERIRLSRHPASLILEGVRRKLDRTSLDKLVGSSATVIELPDRDKLGGIVHVSDLSPEERAALAAFDGQADLAHVARAAGVDVADVLPLAWGLCVLGLATARRAEAEVPDEANALVGETDLAIDRERVRARWQLVTEADYFALLGVRRDATGFEIRRAYQGARRDFAADGFPADLRRELAQELEDIAQVLDEAFRVLRDDRLRLTYLHNLVE